MSRLVPSVASVASYPMDINRSDMTEAEAKAAYIDAIRRGCSAASARYAARINEIEYAHWLNTDPDFVWDFRRAKFELEVELLDKLRASKETKATLALLERTAGQRGPEEGRASMVYDPATIAREWALVHPDAAAEVLVDVLRRLGKL